MKKLLSTLMSLFLLMAFNPGNPAQAQTTGLSFSMENQPLSKYISHIEETTDYIFFLNKEVDTTIPVSLTVKGETIDSVLRKLFEKTDIEYSIKGNQISLKKKQAVQPVSSKHIVRGIVTDSGSDETLIGVGVMIKGTNQIGRASCRERV